MSRKLDIVAVSDLHGQLIPADAKNFWPAGEVLCIAGDIVPLEYQRNDIKSVAWFCSTFYNWVESLPYSKVVLIAGNHDFFLEYMNYPISSLLPPKKLYYLQDSSVKLFGFTFYGTPWISGLPNWAFYADSDMLKRKFSGIPEGVDVLMSHAAPKVDTYGTVLGGSWNHLQDFGCEELAEEIAKKKPQLSIFGHIHSGNHNLKELDGIKYCNVSALSEDYTYVYKPMQITLTK